MCAQLHAHDRSCSMSRLFFLDITYYTVYNLIASKNINISNVLYYMCDGVVSSEIVGFIDKAKHLVCNFCCAVCTTLIDTLSLADLRNVWSRLN